MRSRDRGTDAARRDGDGPRDPERFRGLSPIKARRSSVLRRLRAASRRHADARALLEGAAFSRDGERIMVPGRHDAMRGASTAKLGQGQATRNGRRSPSAGRARSSCRLALCASAERWGPGRPTDQMGPLEPRRPGGAPRQRSGSSSRCSGRGAGRQTAPGGLSDTSAASRPKTLQRAGDVLVRTVPCSASNSAGATSAGARSRRCSTCGSPTGVARSLPGNSRRRTDDATPHAGLAGHHRHAPPG